MAEQQPNKLNKPKPDPMPSGGDGGSKIPPTSSSTSTFPPSDDNSGSDPSSSFPPGMPGEEQLLPPTPTNPGNPNSKLLGIYSRNYKPLLSTVGLYSNVLNPNRPIFVRAWISAMMRDPHVWYGMELLKGPIISKAKFTVESDNQEVADFVQRQLDLFWRKGISVALDALIWGYSGSEIIFEFNEEEDCIDFKDLRYIHPRDIKAVTENGQLVGAEIRNIRGTGILPLFLSQKKIFWTVHDKKFHRWYGRSRLEGAFDSWWEIWQPRGYRGIRHLWFYKNAFSGGVLYYPDGSTQDPVTGEEIPNVLLAQEMLDRKETGSSIALPNKTGDNRDWEWEDAKSNAIPEGLLDYGDILRDEIWEGIGVPPEVAKSEDSGSFAGRRVPQQAFYSCEQELANEIANDFDEQILRYNLVPLKFGKVNYKIVPISILQTLQEEEMGLVTGKLPSTGNDQNVEGAGVDPELDEDGNPIEDDSMGEDGENPFGGKGGKIEDRKSNAFNLKEKAQKNRGKT